VTVAQRPARGGSGRVRHGGELKVHLASLPDAARRKVFGDNAVKFYRLAA